MVPVMVPRSLCADSVRANRNGHAKTNAKRIEAPLNGTQSAYCLSLERVKPSIFQQTNKVETRHREEAEQGLRPWQRRVYHDARVVIVDSALSGAAGRFSPAASVVRVLKAAGGPG